MKKIIVLFMVLFVSSFLFSYEYIMNTNPSVTDTYQGTMKVTTLTYGTWDCGYYDLAVPAVNQFYYYGKLVTHLRISTKGYVVLGHGSASGDGTNNKNVPIPFPTDTPNNMVAPLWENYVLTGATGGAGEIWYHIAQNVNKRNYITVEWRGVRRYNTTNTAYTFSCVFCSIDSPFAANTIIFDYINVVSGNATYDYGLSATAGIENSTGTQGEQYSYNQAIVTNGLKITFTPFVPIYGSTTDLISDSDGYPDAIVFRPSNGYWYSYNSTGTQTQYKLGRKGDVALPGDYDGDGDSDLVYFRPSNSTWEGVFTIIWGTSGDIPVPADYNGDGSLDIAIFRPSSGNWFIYYSGGAGSYGATYGKTGDIPLPADYDGDGHADLAVYRPSNNKWYIRKSTDLTTISKTWGTEGDIPLPTNLRDSSHSDVTVFRPSNGFWYTANPIGAGTYSRQWGQNGDVPVPGDENAGGNTDATVFRPNGGHWYIQAATYLPSSFVWGTLGDKPRFHRSNLIVSPPPLKDH